MDVLLVGALAGGLWRSELLVGEFDHELSWPSSAVEVLRHLDSEIRRDPQHTTIEQTVVQHAKANPVPGVIGALIRLPPNMRGL